MTSTDSRVQLRLLIGAYPPSAGGAQAHTHALARSLQVRGLVEPQVTTLWRTTRTDFVAASTQTSSAPLDDVLEGVPVRTIGLERTSRWDGSARTAYLPMRRVASRHFAAELADPLGDTVVDVVHAVRLGREHLALRGLHEAQRKGLPFVLTPNHHERWSRWWWPDPVWRSIYREADAVVALTPSEAAMLVDLGVASERVVVTGIGPVLSQQARRPAALPHDVGRFVLHLGQQYAYKRLDVTMAAFERIAAQLPDLHLVVAGPPHPESADVLAAARYTDRVHVLGAVDEDEKRWLLDHAGVMAFPSQQEAFGGVVVEAATTGCPVVVGDTPQVVDVVRSLQWGEATDGTVDGFASALAAVLQSDRPSREQREAVTARALTRYGWPSLAALYEGLYARLLGREVTSPGDGPTSRSSAHPAAGARTA